MTGTFKEATPHENDQANLVQCEMVELFNRLAKEGFPVTVLASGAGAAIADLLTCTYGNQMVPTWFAKQAEFTADMIAGRR